MSAERREYTLVRLASLAFVSAVVIGAVFLVVRVWPALGSASRPASDCGCQLIVTPISPIQRWLGWTGAVAAAGLVGPLLFTIAQSLRRQARYLRQVRGRVLRRVEHLPAATWMTVVRDRRPQAFTLGLIRPEIFLTTGLLQTLGKTEVTAVVRHEDAHRQSRDPLAATLFEALGRAWGWMPWVRSWVEAATSLRELTADAVATADYSQIDDLAGAVTKLIGWRPASALAAFSPNTNRVEKLLDRTWRPDWRLWRWQYLAGAVGLVLGLVLLLRVQPAAAQTQLAPGLCREIQTMCRQFKAGQSAAMLCFGAPTGRCLEARSVWIPPQSLNGNPFSLQP